MSSRAAYGSGGVIIVASPLAVPWATAPTTRPLGHYCPATALVVFSLCLDQPNRLTARHPRLGSRDWSGTLGARDEGPGWERPSRARRAIRCASVADQVGREAKQESGDVP